MQDSPRPRFHPAGRDPDQFIAEPQIGLLMHPLKGQGVGEADPAGLGRGDEAEILNEQNPTPAPVVRCTRVYEFAASHRLHSEHLTADENRELFGKCNYPHGHGHNYILEITVTGPIDTRTGRVIDPALLDEIVHRMVVDRYDHRHLNHDIPELEGLVPSTEVVTRAIWERLVGEIPQPSRLASVLIRETARNIFEYRGEA